MKEKKKDPMAKAMDLTSWQSAKTDPQGSWTGTPADPWEKPVQDSDDLSPTGQNGRNTPKMVSFSRFILG